MKEESKNFVLFALLAGLILFGWPFVQNRFFPPANPPVSKVVKGKTVPLPQPGADPTADSPAALRDRALVLRDTPRVTIDTPTMSGSINLKGARIDDLILKQYKETVAKDSPPPVSRERAIASTRPAPLRPPGRVASRTCQPSAVAAWRARSISGLRAG